MYFSNSHSYRGYNEAAESQRPRPPRAVSNQDCRLRRPPRQELRTQARRGGDDVDGDRRVSRDSPATLHFFRGHILSSTSINLRQYCCSSFFPPWRPRCDCLLGPSCRPSDPARPCLRFAQLALLQPLPNHANAGTSLRLQSPRRGCGGYRRI